MSIQTYSNELPGKTVLTTVGACLAYGLVYGSESLAQSRRHHWPYKASVTTFAWTGTFPVCHGGRTEGNIDKAEGIGGVRRPV